MTMKSSSEESHQHHHHHHHAALPNRKSGLFGAVSNMVNFIVGAGIVGIPYAISNTGLVVGVVLLALISVIMDKTMRMIVELATYHPKLRTLGICSYEGLARVPFGRTGAGLVLGGILILSYGAMLAYLLIIKDTVPTIVGLTKEAGQGSFMEVEAPMLLTSLVIIVPLSMMRDMASLKKMSALSVLADLVLVGFVICFAPVRSTVSEAGGFVQVINDNPINNRLFIGLGVLSTAMACQHGAFIVSNSLEDLTPARWSLVSVMSIGISAGLCLVLGIVGYLGFLDETKGVILNNFGADSTIANAGRGLLAITMFFTYPMKAFVVRNILIEYYFDGNLDGINDTLIGKYIGPRHSVTLAIYVSTLVPALIVNDMGPVLSITGAVGASFLSYIGIGMIYLGVNGEDFLSCCLSKLVACHGLQLVSSSEVDSDNNDDKDNKVVVADDCPKDTDILSHCQKMLDDHQDHYDQQMQKQIRITSDDEVEIPCDASASTGAVSSEQTLPTTEDVLTQMKKPLWWYLCGYPIWVAIASRGAKGTREYILEYFATDGADQNEDVEENGVLGNHVDNDASGHRAATANTANRRAMYCNNKLDDGNSHSDNSHLFVIGPCERDYYVCMFVITFGTLAAVIGLASNIYVGIEHFLKPV